MQSTHTPGPWDLENDDVVAGGLVIATVATTEDFEFDSHRERRKAERECAANGRLLAAAPDLHKALSTLVEIEGQIGMDLGERETALAAARAALTKAAQGAPAQAVSAEVHADLATGLAVRLDEAEDYICELEARIVADHADVRLLARTLRDERARSESLAFSLDELRGMFFEAATSYLELARHRLAMLLIEKQRDLLRDLLTELVDSHNVLPLAGGRPRVDILAECREALELVEAL